MNSLAGALPYDDAWEDAGELVEDDGGYNKRDIEQLKKIIEKTLKHFGIRAMVWVMEMTKHSIHFRIQTEDSSDVDEVRSLQENLELALDIRPVSFADIPNNDSSLCMIIPKS